MLIRPAGHRCTLTADFLAGCSYLLVYLMAPFLLNGIVLYNAGELLPLDEIAQIQQRDDVLYGSAIHDVRREHKLALIQARKPDIIALGSSRTSAFRQEFSHKLSLVPVKPWEPLRMAPNTLMSC